MNSDNDTDDKVGGMMSSLRKMIVGGKGEGPEDGGPEDGGPEEDTDADELVLDGGISPDALEARVRGVDGGDEDDDDDALVLSSAIPGEESSSGPDEIPDGDQASDGGQDEVAVESGAGDQDASPLDDGLELATDTGAESGASGDGGSADDDAAADDVGKFASDDSDGKDSTDNDGLIRSPRVTPVEMATIFSGLGVEETGDFGGQRWATAVRDEIGGEPTDASSASPDSGEDSASEPSDPGVGAIPDPQALEDIIRRVIREELAGEMGQRLSTNIRKMIRDQIASALFARD